MKYVQAIQNGGSWILPDNDIWNVPAEPANEVRFESEHFGMWHICRKLKALVVSLDGKVFGVRSMNWPKENGYGMKGRVSIGGKKVEAFTSSTLFERENGSLVDVAVFVLFSTSEEKLGLK